MSRMYTVAATSTQATAGDILEISAASDSCVILHSVAVTQSNSQTDDSTEIRISRWTTSGSGGTTETARPSSVGDAAFGGAVESFNTTDATTGEILLWSEGVSTLAGFNKIWTPETRPELSPSGIVVVKFVGDVTSIIMVVSAEFEEIGG